MTGSIILYEFAAQPANKSLESITIAAAISHGEEANMRLDPKNMVALTF